MLVEVVQWGPVIGACLLMVEAVVLGVAMRPGRMQRLQVAFAEKADDGYYASIRERIHAHHVTWRTQQEQHMQTGLAIIRAQAGDIAEQATLQHAVTTVKRDKDATRLRKKVTTV